MLKTVSDVYKVKMGSEEHTGNLRIGHAEKGIGEITDSQKLNWT